MAIKEGDLVRAKRELRGGLLGLSHVGAGKEGVVFKVGMFSGYSVRFEDGTKIDDLTDDDIEPKTSWW